jgi:hypothetical protein
MTSALLLQLAHASVSGIAKQIKSTRSTNQEATGDEDADPMKVSHDDVSLLLCAGKSHGQLMSQDERLCNEVFEGGLKSARVVGSYLIQRLVRCMDFAVPL